MRYNCFMFHASNTDVLTNIGIRNKKIKHKYPYCSMRVFDVQNALMMYDSDYAGNLFD